MTKITKIIETDLEKIVEDAIELTIVKGLNDDKEELISDYNKDTFYNMQNDYRMYGALFGMNFKKNLEEIFENLIEGKEN